MDSNRVFIKIFREGKAVGVQQFSTDQITIGSGSETSVSLKGDKVSSWHCSIVKKDGSYSILDLGSDTGTILNGEPIIEKILKHGDQFQIGDYNLEFYIGMPFVQEAKQKTSSFFSKKKKSVASPTPTPTPTQVSTPPPADEWKNTIPIRPSKKTFAPPPAISNLEKVIPLGKGNVVEVLVAWGGIITDVYHTSSSETITVGSTKKATIHIPQLPDTKLHSLIKVSSITQICLTSSMKGKIITKSKEIDFDTAIQKEVISTHSNNRHQLSLGQNELIVIQVAPEVTLYVRYTATPSKVVKSGLFQFTQSEMLGLALSSIIAIVLFYVVSVYFPKHVQKKEKATPPAMVTIRFSQPVQPPPTQPPRKTKKRVVKKRPKKAKPRTVRRSRRSKPRPRKDISQRGLLPGLNSGINTNPGQDLLSDLGKDLGATSRNYPRRGQRLAERSGEVDSSFELDKSSVDFGDRTGRKGFRGGRVSSDISLVDVSDDISYGGDIDANLVRRVVRSRQFLLNQCYRIASQNIPVSGGKILINWDFNSQGRVIRSRVQSNTTGSNILADCMAKRIRTFNFKGGIIRDKEGIGSVTYTFTVPDAL